MLRLRKCKNSEIHCTVLYFSVLSLAFILSLVLTIWRNDITRNMAFQLPPGNYVPLIRNTERVKAVELNGQIEREQETAVTESNFTVSAQAQSPVGKLNNNKKNNNIYFEISTPGIRGRTKVAESLLHKPLSHLDGKNDWTFSDLENRKTDSSPKTYLKSDRDTYKPGLTDYSIYEDTNTLNKTVDNDDIVPEVIINNTSQDIINEDWVIALRARTTRMGIRRKRNLHWTIGMAGKYSSDLFTPPHGEIPRQRLPQAIIIGVGHCGTRALIDFLTMHPHIVSSNTEIHFFDRDENFSKGYNWYRAQMPLSYSNQITLEKTPCYIWSERALNEIYNMNRKTKLIVILKDPVARLISMRFTYNPELINATDALTDGVLHTDYDSKALTHGAYVKFLKPWFNKYPVSQIHVLEGSEFMKDPAKEINQLESFLQVPHFITEDNFYFNSSKGFYCMRPLHTGKVSCLSDNKGRHHPLLDPLVERKLYEYYRDHNEKLFQLLGRRYSWGVDYMSNSVPQRNSSHRGNQ